MLIAEVQFFNVVVFLHIGAVVLTFGPTYGYAFFVATAESAHPKAVPAVMESILKIDRALVSIGMLVILASGIYLVEDANWDYGEFFVSWGMTAIVVLLGLAHGFFRPHTRKLRELAIRDLGESGDGKLSEEYLAESKLVARVGMLAGIIVILTIYVMAAKPFL